METIILCLLSALVLTCIIEMVPHFFLKDKSGWIKSGLICNIVTNPPLNAFLMLLSAFSVNAKLILGITIILELTIVFAEAKLYSIMLSKHFKSCLIISAICNGISYLTGLLLDEILLRTIIK